VPPLFKRLFVHPPLAPLLIVASFVPGFFDAANLVNLGNQVALYGIVVTGLVVVMIAAGFDLSLGVVMAVAGVTAMTLAPHGLPLAFAGALLAGAACGLLNGFLIAILRINPFIASFAMLVMLRGGILYLTDTRPVAFYDPILSKIGRGTILGVPITLLVALAVMLIIHVALTTRPWGRHLYALGSDERAARLAGLKVRRLKIGVYVLCSVLAALAGVLLAARVSTGSPIVGETTALMAAAAALLGGATLRGGEGSVAGAAVGLLFVGLMVNVMNLLVIPAYYQRIAIGALLILLVVMDGLVARWRGR
jgi:Ribose/xylose/arabinose/galactoside ABC-type transport systems, permease components